MKRHLLLVPMILATTVAIADAQTKAASPPADAQAHAAALLSRPHALGAAKAATRSLAPSPVTAALDAHESAATLLSGGRPINRVNASPATAESSSARASTDAQAQAAALLSGANSGYGRIAAFRTLNIRSSSH
jgi:hypothetical protein